MGFLRKAIVIIGVFAIVAGAIVALLYWLGGKLNPNILS